MKDTEILEILIQAENGARRKMIDAYNEHQKRLAALEVVENLRYSVESKLEIEKKIKPAE